MKTLQKKKKLKSLSTLKSNLDEVFSQYIRLIHANDDGYVECYTCGKVLFWQNNEEGAGIQCGHLFSRQKLATRFNSQNCRPQCWQCNGIKKGNYDVFHPKVMREIGNEAYFELAKKASLVVKINRHEYISSIDIYKSEVERLRKEKGL